MKIRICLIFAAAVLLQFPEPLGAATLSLDTFSDGSFQLGSGGSASTQDAIVSDLVSQRTVNVVGSLENWSWGSQLNPPAGMLALSASRSISGGRDLRYSLNYGTLSPFTLLGYSAFELEFAAVTGSGLLEIIIGSSDRNQVVQIAIDSPGLVSYPFENLAASSLDDLTGINVSFFPDDDGFSFQLDEIRVVPEPSGLSLIALGVMCMSFRRCRNT